MRTGIANLPLHYGSAPRWLFDRMKKLASQISQIIVWDYGPEEILLRLSDPFWFQAFGCVLGFDWHSSGVTTTAGGALKEGLKGLEKNLGIVVAGGKGATSRKTPQEIQAWGEKLSLSSEIISQLIYASKMSAKVDNTAVQDGFQLYHHNFIFTQSGLWTVVQQGMNPDLKSARRYHWFSSSLEDFVEEPHSGIISEKETVALDLTAKQSRETRRTSVALIKDNFSQLIQDARLLSQDNWADVLNLPQDHPIYPEHFDHKRLGKILNKIKEKDPEDFERLLGIEGVGPKTILALSLISELIYGTKPSWKDPARYSFAHGGKDGYPYPLQKETYDQSIQTLKKAIQKAKLSRSEKIQALRSLNFLKD
jgi:hypothetical protein